MERYCKNFADPTLRKEREGWGTRGSLARENSQERCHHSIAVLLVCCTALLTTACNKSEEAPPPAVYVQAVHPVRGTISEPITADATLAPLAQAAISPKVTAPVKKFFVQRGSHVRSGQLLATLENSDLEAAAL